MHPPTLPPPPSRVSRLFVPLLIVSSLSAQSLTAPPVRESPADDATILLSPFEVNTARDTGYAAQETLAGTRLRTSLRDVGAALTVLTPEFFQDLGLTSPDRALLFTPSVDSVEGDNVDANRASGGFLRYGTGQSFSIRGFVSNSGEQAASTDFFSSPVAGDLYNLERVTLSRGPNALLIGVGAPQGVSVSSVKRAQLQRTRTQVQAQYDRWSSRRASLDHNQVLVPGKLALRLNLLHDEKREFRIYEGKNQERLTFGVAARPFAHTQVTVNHEAYTLHRNVSPLSASFDGGILQWLAKGAPSVQFRSQGLAWTAANRAFTDASGNRIPVAPGVVDSDGWVDAAADFDPRSALTQFTAQQPTWIVGLPLANPMVNMRFQSQVRPNTFGGIQNQGAFQAYDPWALYGIRRDTNLSAGTWDDPSQREHGRWTQVFVEQRLREDLYLELAGNLARHARSFSPDQFNIVKMDVDRYLPDGTPNPGYLVPYSETQGQYRDQLGRTHELRATLSYQLDLTKKHRWLGQHGLGALFQTSQSDSDQDILRVFNLATVGRTGAGWTGDALGAPHIVRTRAYFLDGRIPYPLPDQHQLVKQIGTLNAQGSLLGSSANESAPILLGLRQHLNSTKSRFTDDALSLGWQARWLDQRLVTVLGWRRDSTESFGVPTVRGVADPSISGSATDPLKRYYTPSRDIPLNDTPSVSTAGITRTYGVVHHTLPWLSLAYNRSSNFNPVANASWRNFEGTPAPNSRGETEDYGVRLHLLQGRLSLSLSRFTTSAKDQARNANFYSNNIKNILTRLRTAYKDAGDSHFSELAAAGAYPVDNTDVSDTWSYEAKGYELSVVFNPSARWRIALNGSSNENALGEHLSSFGRYLASTTPFQGLENWKRIASELRRVENGQRSSQFDLDPASPSARNQAAVDAQYLEQQIASVERTYRDEKALEGVATHRNGKYAFNGLITHIFARQGPLSGWSVGGNFRWRSANIVAYERELEGGVPTGTILAGKPIRGDDYWDLGAMLAYERRIFRTSLLRLQLNVENPLDWSRPRLVSSDYDSEGVLGTTNAPVPIRWELRRPRNYILTATFTF